MPVYLTFVWANTLSAVTTSARLALASYLISQKYCVYSLWLITIMIKYYHFSRAVVTLDVDRNVSTVPYSTSFAGVNWIFTLSWEDKIFPTTMKGSYVGPFFYWFGVNLPCHIRGSQSYIRTTVFCTVNYLFAQVTLSIFRKHSPQQRSFIFESNRYKGYKGISSFTWSKWAVSSGMDGSYDVTVKFPHSPGKRKSDSPGPRFRDLNMSGVGTL